VRSFRSLHQLLTLSLWRCRSRRACVRACVHPHARVCGRVFIHMRRCTCVRVHAYARALVYAYTCARVCTCMHVRTYAQMEGPGGGASACQVSWARVPMCMCMYVHAYMHGRICARPAVRVTCTLEQVFWTLVHGRVCTLHRCVFTQTCTSVTHSLQVVHMCVYVCMCVYGCVCVWMRTCVYDIA